MTNIHPMMNIYKIALKKGTDWGKYYYYQYLEDGITYPRGKLLEIAEGIKFFETEVKKAKTSKAKNKIKPEIIKILFRGDSMNVGYAYEKLEKAYQRMNLSRKSRKFTNFILLKKRYPKLAKYKFLAWII